jgi:hypothetical protein
MNFRKNLKKLIFGLAGAFIIAQFVFFGIGAKQTQAVAEDIVSGTLSARSAAVTTAESVSITITAQDDQGVKILYAHYQGTWHEYICSAGATSCTNTWTFSESIPGKKDYYGSVVGTKVDGAPEIVYTVPSYVSVVVTQATENQKPNLFVYQSMTVDQYMAIFMIGNNGNAPATNFLTAVDLAEIAGNRTTNEVIADKSINFVRQCQYSEYSVTTQFNAGAQTSYACNYATSLSLKPNTYYAVKMTTDIGNDVSESNESDNVQYATFKTSGTICTDSDGGQDYYVKGVVTEVNQYTSWQPNAFSDVCVSDTNLGNLAEAVCEKRSDGYYYGSQAYYTCPNGCKDGACVKEALKPACTSLPCFFDAKALTNTWGTIDSPPAWISAIYPYSFEVSSTSPVKMTLKSQVWANSSNYANTMFVKVDGRQVYSESSSTKNSDEKSFSLGTLSAGLHRIEIFATPDTKHFHFDWFKLETTSSECASLYWHDNTTKICEYKQFCGAYAYLGLKTFTTQAACQKSLDTICSLDCQAKGYPLGGAYCVANQQGVLDTCCCTGASTKAVKVISPNGYEQWEKGKTYNIQWEGPTNIGWSGAGVTINLYKYVNDNLTFVKQIATGLPLQAKGSYSWTIPTDLDLGSSYRIRMDDYASYDLSDNSFIIKDTEVGQSIQLTYPNGGETWERGRIYSIKWTTTGSVPKVSVMWNSSVTGQFIVQGIDNAGSYNWTIPSDFALGQYKIRVSGTDYSNATDVSDNSFSIVATGNTCTDSDGGYYIYTKGYTTWSDAQAGAQNRIEYDKCVIQHQSGNDYDYEDVNECMGNRCFVWENTCFNNREASGQELCPYGCKDGACIKQSTTTSITVLSPNGGEKWEKGKTYIIRWSSSLSKVNLILYKGFNCSYSSVISKNVCGNVFDLSPTPPTFIAVDVPNTGSYNWTIPSIIPDGNDYRIAVQNPSNLPYIDQSDEAFSIVSSSTGNLPPVISSFSGPTQLKVGEKGAWKIQARDPENGNLTYNINWGDNVVKINEIPTAANKATQIGMFSHSYSASGNYTIKFTVVDDKGLSAEASLTVSVVGENGWKTYSNNTVGFSIKYPTTWILIDSGAGPELAYLQSPKNATAGKCRSAGCDLPSTMKISEYSIGGTNLKSYLDKQAALSDPTYTNVQSVKIGSVDGYSADKGPNQFGGGTSYFVQSKTNTSDAIEFWFFSSDSDYSSSNTQKILSTFKFTQDATPPSDCLPNGTLIKMPNDFKVYVIQDCKKKWIQSIDEFKQSGYKWNNVTETPADTVNAYNDYTQAVANLLKIANQEKVYRIVGNRKLWIPSPQAFNTQGLKWQDVQTKDASTVNQYPDAKLLRAIGGTTIYYITNSGLKRAIPNMDVFNSYGSKLSDVVDVDQSVLNSYPDNILIKEDNGIMVYKLENGTKRWIATDKAFKRLGLDWSKIAPVNQTEFNAYPNGLTIE